MDANLLKTRYCIGIPDLPNPQGMNVVTIAGLDSEDYTAKEGRKQVPKTRHLLIFAELRLPFRLNNKRLDILTLMFGADTDKWVGRKIGLYVGAVSEWGETELSVLMHVQPADHLPAIPAERGSRAAQLPPGAWPSHGGAAAQGDGWHRGAAGGFAVPNQPAAPAFDTRAMGEPGKRKLFEGLASIGANLDDVFKWLRQHNPQACDQIAGKDVAEWPLGIGPAIKELLLNFPNPPGYVSTQAPAPRSAPAQPLPPIDVAATSMPARAPAAGPPINAGVASRAVNVPPVPADRPVTEDDIPF